MSMEYNTSYYPEDQAFEYDPRTATDWQGLANRLYAADAYRQPVETVVEPDQKAKVGQKLGALTLESAEHGIRGIGNEIGAIAVLLVNDGQIPPDYQRQYSLAA